MSLQSVLGKRSSSSAEDQPPAKVAKTTSRISPWISTPENDRARALFDKAVRPQFVEKQEMDQLQQKVGKLETQMDTGLKTMEEMKGLVVKFIQKQDTPTKTQQSNAAPADGPQTISPTDLSPQTTLEKTDELTQEQDTPTQTQQSNAAPADGPQTNNLTGLPLQAELQKANEHFSRQNFKEAIPFFLLANLAETHPQYGEVQYKLGMSFYRTKEYKNAFSFLDRVSDSHPDSANINYILGKINFDSKIYTLKTIECLLKVPFENRDYGSAQFRLARTYAADKQYLKAIKHFNNIPSTHRRFCPTRISIARAYLCLNDYPNAIKYIVKAKELLNQTEQSEKIGPQNTQKLLTNCNNLEKQLPPQ